MVLKGLILSVLALSSWSAYAARMVDIYLYNDTDGELIYPEAPVVMNQPCTFGENTIGPDYQTWQDYAMLEPRSFANQALPFRIFSPNFLGYPALEHCHYVASARPNEYFSDFTIYHTPGEYCLKNSVTAKKLYAYLTSTGDLSLSGVYIVTIGIVPIRETCLPD